MSESSPKPDRSGSDFRSDNQERHGQSSNDQSDNNQRSGRNKGRSSDNSRPKKTKFKGGCSAIEDYVYDVGQPTSNQELYSTTTKKIAEYIARTYDRAGEFRNALINLKFEPLDRPKLDSFATLKEDPTDKTKKTKVIDDESKELWKDALKTYSKKQDARDVNEGKAFALILGQCSDMIRSKMESHADWEKTNDTSDPIALLKIVKHCMVHKTTTRHEGYSLIEALENLGRFRQGEKMNVEDYRDRLISLIDIYKDLGGEPGIQKKLVSKYGSEASALEAYTALLLIKKSDPKRYGDLQNDLANDFTRGLDGYPDTISKAYDMLANYRPLKRNNNTNNNNYPKNELSFATYGDEDDTGRGGRGRGRGGRGYGRGRGGGFQHKGGVADNQNKDESEDYSSPDRITSEDDEIIETTISLQISEGKLPSHWLLMDSCSSSTIISNPRLVHNIHKSKQRLRVHGSTGSKILSYKASFGDYPKLVWFDHTGPANILSMDEVGDFFRLTMDTQDERSINLHTSDGRIIKFKPLMARLYSHELQLDDDGDRWSFIQTVKTNQEYYTRREVARADAARRFQNIIMRPGTKYMADTIIKHMPNCPVTRRDITIAEDIYGPNLGSIKGKTPTRKVKHVHGSTDPVPPDILLRHGQVSIAIDIMFVNKVPFLISHSRSLRFGIVSHIINRKLDTVGEALQAMVEVYTTRGFKINQIYADYEFEKLRPRFPKLNTAGTNDHVPEIERYIRTVKDRARSTYRMLPYQYIPRLALIQLIHNCVFWLNAFPHPDGVSKEYSPRYLLTGKQLDYNNHVRMEFGAYGQVHREHSNDMNERAVGGICLGPTGNNQGTHYFISLATGERINGTHWTPLPMPEEVIQRIEYFGKKQGFPKTLTFADRHGNEIKDSLDEAAEWEDDDEDYVPTDDSSYEDDNMNDRDDASVIYDTDPVEDEHVLEDEDIGHPEDDLDMSDPDPEDIQDGPGQDEYSNTGPSDILETDPVDLDTPNETDSIIEPPENTGAGEPPETTGAWTPDPESHETTGAVDGDSASTSDDEPITLQDEFDHAETTGARAAVSDEQIPKRTRTKIRDPSFLYNIFNTSPAEAFNYLMRCDYEESFCFLTEQMTAKKGLKKFKEAGAKAIMAELEQIVYRKVMRGKHAKDLTREDKKAALRYLMFLKQKRSGKIKARGCADGRKQRLYKGKDETTSPTVTTEGLMLTCIVDAHERRDVATMDVPGAFMHADMDEKIHIKLDGELALLLIRVDESYSQFLTYERGIPVIYAELSKALYGTLQAAKLFWENLTSFLCSDLGFTLNPYDSCVANKTINGKQCTIAWHVDDLKISHVDSRVVDEIITRFEEKYGKESPLSVTRGRVHEYLGMTIDYSTPGVVSFIMKDYVADIIKEKADDMDDRTATTPASQHLYHTNDNAVKLGEYKADYFHHMVAKLLYLGKRGRPDILTAVSFLCTRVKEPDIDDYKKLNRCINYLEGTQDLFLTLGTDGECVVNWWVDASFAVHEDMKSHTGAAMSLGRGSVINKSSKQKINTRSSTEAEVVGVNDAMTMILWTRLFLEEQGVIVKDNIIQQDNQSSILLEKNGKESSGKQTRHMEIRYFFVTDAIKRGMARIDYCPTELMHADFFTKPLQGQLFRAHRAMILGLSSVKEVTKMMSETSRDVMDKDPQERVE